MKGLIVAGFLILSINQAVGCVGSAKSLRSQNDITCVSEVGVSKVDFVYSSVDDRELMVHWEAETCLTRATKKYEWLTYNENGHLESIEEVSRGPFYSYRGKKHILRVSLTDLVCPDYTLNFGVQTF